MKASLSVLPLFLATCCHAGHAQPRTPSITVHGTEIRLGAPSGGVIAVFQRNYVVQPDGKSPVQGWYVSTNKNSLPFVSLYVKGNSIVGIEYLVTERETDSAQEVFAALYSAISKLSSEGRNTCSVSNSTDYVPPNLSKSAVFFSCGVYQLRLQRNEFQTADGRTLLGFMVWESLGNTD